MSNRLNIEQKRAKTAFDFAQRATESHPFTEGVYAQNFYKAEGYDSNAKKVPMYIKANGLGNTLAFMYSKRTKKKKENNQEIYPGQTNNRKDAWYLIYDQIRTWLEDEEHSIIAERLKNEPNKELIKHITELNTDEYRAVTKEILALFSWIKRFVKDE